MSPDLSISSFLLAGLDHICVYVPDSELAYFFFFFFACIWAFFSYSYG